MMTSDRLRTDIDHGRTGEKVAVSDPAAAPLGTDEEAAGTPPKPEAIGSARRHELKHERRRNDGNKISALLYLTILAGIMIILTGVLLYVLGMR